MKAVCDKALRYSPADQTEVVILGEDSALTRFANSYIHQNVAESNREVRVRAVIGKRIGVASTNDLSDTALQKVVESAVAIARLQPENPDFTSLPGPATYQEVKAYSQRTATCTPEERARAAAIFCAKAKEAGLVASGALQTAVYEVAVANSLGLFAYAPSTVAECNTVIMADSGSGYAEGNAVDVSEIDFEGLAEEAVEKAMRSRHPVSIDPGEYTVILEEYAVGDILDYLGYLGFGALAVQEGRSFMKLGEKVLGDNISIWDDGLDPRSLPMPFDYEGVPKRRVDLIVAGKATGIVYDSYTAGRDGKQSTGHALPAPNTLGPLPLNMFLQTGTSTKDDMLASTDRGIWVTRFHYTRPVHPMKVIITGMTRDGTFLIERGELAQPIKNLRFTQSYLDVLSRTTMIGRETKLVKGILGGNRAPALKVEGFSFTGMTQF
jgi:predicted Zn-dependent protease